MHALLPHTGLIYGRCGRERVAALAAGGVSSSARLYGDGVLHDLVLPALPNALRVPFSLFLTPDPFETSPRQCCNIIMQ